MRERKKKLRCPNCGTAIKEEQKSCPVCHQIIERPKEETAEGEEESFELKAEFPFGKIVMGIIIVIGIVLTVKGIVEYQNVEYCTADDCGFRSLFLAGLGIILIISAGIALARDGKKYKEIA